MIRKNDIQFRQSRFDFPLDVSLGRKVPEWSLSRWKENRGLWFVPYDDEGFSLRGDRRQLLYKGNRRSHRFTILGDGAFEYDCILNKEPESNVISLRMEGAGNFDFFRQPDFVPDPFLKGSYAVYLKDTMIGQGTGKLCHIHRPLIIDALGRKCWGVLSVVGDELRITIPEDWLAKAKYPVIVDPVVGTTTVGANQQPNYVYGNNQNIHYTLIGALTVNRFLIPENYNGTANAFVYVFDRGVMGTCKPIMYSDNGNKPLNRMSSNEANFNITVQGNTWEWRSTAFDINVQANSYIWYGLTAALFRTLFDYGAKNYWYSYDTYTTNLPNTFPFYPDERFYDYKYSMYFSYTNAQNYIRTLTQGVTINENRKSIGNYKRQSTQTATINEVKNVFKTIFIKCIMTVTNTMNITNKIFFNRVINEITNIADYFTPCREYFAGIYEQAVIQANVERYGGFYITKNETVTAHGSLFRSFLLFVKILTTTAVRDFIINRFLIAKEELALKSCVTRELILDSKIC